MLRRCIIFLLAAWPALTGSHCFGQVVVELKEAPGTLSAALNFEYCLETGPMACPDSAFRLMTDDVISEGFVPGGLLIRTKLRNNTLRTLDLRLELANPSLNAVRIWLLDDGDTVKTAFFTDRQPFRVRGYAHRNYILPFEMEPDHVLDILIRVSPQRESLFVPLRITSEDYFHRTSAIGQLLLGGMFGMYAIYIVFILSLFLLWKSRLFLYYALLDLFVLMYCLFDTGYGFQFLWPTMPYIQQWIVPFLAFGYVISLMSFTREFFSTAIKYPVMDKLLMSYLVISFGAFAAVIVIYNIIGLSLVVPLIILVVLFVLFGVTVSGLGMVTYLQSGRREGFWFVSLLSLYLVLFALILHQKGYLGIFLVRPDSPLYFHLPIFTGMPHYIFDMMFVEMLVVSAIIAFRFQDVLQEYNLSKRRIEQMNAVSIKEFIRGQEAEREALAVRLHRGIGIGLRAIEDDLISTMPADPSRKLPVALEHLHDVRADLRQITSDFTIDWTEIELELLIDRVFRELQRALPDANIEVEKDAHLREFPFSEMIKQNLYRILQEACNNIIRHASADHISAGFIVRDDTLYAEVHDTGVGFDIDHVVLQAGIGLRNMETRVHAMNGRITIDTEPGTGTSIKITVPLNVNAAP